MNQPSWTATHEPHTLKDVEWDSARLSDQAIEEEVLELKHQSGKDILVGGPSLIVQLMKLNQGSW